MAIGKEKILKRVIIGALVSKTNSRSQAELVVYLQLFSKAQSSKYENKKITHQKASQKLPHSRDCNLSQKKTIPHDKASVEQNFPWGQKRRSDFPIALTISQPKSQEWKWTSEISQSCNRPTHRIAFGAEIPPLRWKNSEWLPKTAEAWPNIVSNDSSYPVLILPMTDILNPNV